jgi:hypothetical protein
MKISLTVICLFLSTCAGAITTQEKELIEKWIQAKKDFSIMQRGGGKAIDFIRAENALKDVAIQSLDRAFADSKYDRPDSFLGKLLSTPSISPAVASKVCRLQFQKASVDNEERGRLCNFMIQTLYESRPTNTNYADSIRSVLLENEHPEVYSDQTKDIVKKLILKGHLHFSHSAIAGITADKDINAYLSAIMEGKDSAKSRIFIESWVATCILAQSGDPTAYQRVKDTANGLTNLTSAMYVPLGMAYIGNKEMVSRMFEMLKSDLKEWNGEDVRPQETQLAHEAAAMLSLCVKEFPRYNTRLRFTAEDKAKCLKWVKEYKDTFVIENKSPLYYFTKTRFDQVGH